MRGGQEPQRSRGDGGPGRSVYLARRIVAVLVVLVLLALLVPRACQAFTGSEEEPGSEGSQVTEVSGVSEEETATTQEGAGGSSEVADAMTVVVRPVPAGGEETSRAENGGVPSVEVAASPAGAVVAGPEAPFRNMVDNITNQATLPSTAAPSTAPPSTAPVSNVFTGNQQQMVQPTAFGEMIPPSGSVAFGEENTFGEEAPIGEGVFKEGPGFEDQGASGVTVAKAGSVVAIAGSSVAIA